MKIIPLPSANKVVEIIPEYDKSRLALYGDMRDRITQDRDQAYTSLIEGIEARMEILNELYAKYNLEIDKHSIYELQQIIEKVVKPLYNKE